MLLSLQVMKSLLLLLLSKLYRQRLDLASMEPLVTPPLPLPLPLPLLHQSLLRLELQLPQQHLLRLALQFDI